MSSSCSTTRSKLRVLRISFQPSPRMSQRIIKTRAANSTAPIIPNGISVLPAAMPLVSRYKAAPASTASRATRVIIRKFARYWRSRQGLRRDSTIKSSARKINASALKMKEVALSA